MSAYHRNALPAGYRLAEYTIESVLGHGGFGITYLARDTSLGALVAIKEYLPHEIAVRDGKTAVLPNSSREAVRDYHWGLKNFVKEARALAHFKHPNIVRVLRFLEANGTAYVVMEYEEGKSLADHLKHHGPRLDEPTLLRIFIPILNGLHAVHEADMLHLDIKPENIYIRRDGHPMLIDFGSARQAITSASHTQRIALTHGYAPVEQYPDKGTPGPWTDVYAIGATMYRSISGRRPEDALERYKAQLKYQVDPLTPAVKIGKNHYQQNLLDCIDWAIQIHPKDRPQSARELQDALMGKGRPGQQKPLPASVVGSRAITSEPRVAARAAPPSPPVPRRRRYKAPGLPLAHVVQRLTPVLLLVVVVAGVVYFWSTFRSLLPGTEGPEVRPPVSERPPVGARRQTAKEATPEPAPTPEPARPSVPPAAKAVKLKSAPTVPFRTLVGHKDWVQTVTFSPDGKWIASGSNDRTIKLWETESGALLATLRGQGSAVNAVAFSFDGKWIASAGNDGSVRLWDAKTGGPRGALHGYGGSLFAAAFSPDGHRLAAAGKDRSVILWEVESGRRAHVFDGHKGDVYVLAFAPDGKTLATAGADKTVRLWNWQTGQEVGVLSGHKDPVLSLAFSPDGKWLATGDAGQAIRIWDARTGAHVRTLTDIHNSVLSLAFSPDGKWLAAGAADQRITFFDGAEGTVVHILGGHKDIVQTIAFSPNGTLLASGGRDNSVRTWKAK
jgi:WD40 repeat protein/serine/threonine protein kinase